MEFRDLLETYPDIYLPKTYNQWAWKEIFSQGRYVYEDAFVELYLVWKHTLLSWRTLTGFVLGARSPINSAITVVTEGSQNSVATRCFFKASLGALLLDHCFSSLSLVMLFPWISHHWVQCTAQSSWIKTPLISSTSPLHGFLGDLVVEDHISLRFGRRE